MEEKKPHLLDLWLVIGVLAGFALIIFFTVNYFYSVVLCDVHCAVKNEIAIALVSLSLAGLFVGSLTYYFISEKYEKRIGKIHRKSLSTLKFLDGDERKAVKILVEKGGVMTQNQLVKESGLSRVKISRMLKKFKRKSVVEKRRKGLTNRVELKEDLRSVLCQGE